MEEQAVTSEAGGMAADGGVGGSQGAGDLSEGGALAEHGGDGNEQVPSAEPVGGGEGDGAEASAAGATAEVLEAAAVGGAGVEAVADEGPVELGDMEAAAGVGAAGGMEAPDAMREKMSTLVGHDLGMKPGSCRSVPSGGGNGLQRQNRLRERALPPPQLHSRFHNLSV